jgi:hypothetical protein
LKVTIMAAFPGTGLGAYTLAQVRQHAGAQPWALLAVGMLNDLGLDRAAIDVEFGRRVRLLHLAAACACCTAGPVLSVSLNRLLRAGPLDHLLVLADARAHLEGLSQALAAVLGNSRKASLAPASESMGSESMAPAPMDPERIALMTPAQRVLLDDPGRAGHEAALALRTWAGGCLTFIAGPAPP